MTKADFFITEKSVFAFAIELTLHKLSVSMLAKA